MSESRPKIEEQPRRQGVAKDKEEQPKDQSHIQKQAHCKTGTESPHD
jgi:hypothetical protein